jgi:hypothetical protein
LFDAVFGSSVSDADSDAAGLAAQSIQNDGLSIFNDMPLRLQKVFLQGTKCD